MSTSTTASIIPSSVPSSSFDPVMPNGQVSVGLPQQQELNQQMVGVDITLPSSSVSLASTTVPSSTMQFQQQTATSIPGIVASSSTTAASSVIPGFKPMAGMVPTPLVQASQPIMATGNLEQMGIRPQQPFGQPARRMVSHQQSWSEGKFEAALSQSGFLSTSQESVSSPHHKLNRRRSMSQVTGLPQDYGVNTVLEPLAIKFPTVSVAVSSPQMTPPKEEVLPQETSKDVEVPVSEYSV